MGGRADGLWWARLKPLHGTKTPRRGDGRTGGWLVAGEAKASTRNQDAEARRWARVVAGEAKASTQNQDAEARRWADGDVALLVVAK